MEPSAKKTVWTVIAVVVIIGIGYFVFSSPSLSGKAPAAKTPSTPPLTDEQVLGRTPLSSEQEGSIVAEKTRILKLVASGKTLSQEEKSQVGNIMLTQAHLYKFTPEEREAVFAALRK